jgi:DNA polymerase III alpha subunit
MTNIKSITQVGTHQTYDLEVDHPDHQFYLANGVLTSNSHAVAYAIDSYWCAWLMTYYEEQWLCAYLESMSNTPDQRAKAFGEVKALGYQIVPIDINHASLGWTVLPGKKLMPSMTSCKGVGDSAVEEIMQNRPYNTIEELLWDDEFQWRHSKFNKKALEALIKIGAFNSMNMVGEGKIFRNYRHMYEVLLGSHVETQTKKRKGVEVTEEVELDHSQLVKRSTKTDPHEGLKNFYELVRKYNEIEDWSSSEKAQNMIDVFGALDVTAMIDSSLLTALEEKGIKSIDQLDVGEKSLAWFCVLKTTPKKTKTGKNYLLLDAVGPSGKTMRVNMWGWDGKKEFDPYAVCVAETEKNDFGVSTTMWRLKELN